MYDQNAGADSQAVSRFWHNYLSILEKASVPEGARKWYRIYADRYIQAHPGVRLSAHTPQLVDDYRTAKGRMAE